MKAFYYKVRIVLDDGSTDSHSSSKLSNIVLILTDWLKEYPVIQWSIVKVFDSGESPYELTVLSETCSDNV